MTARFAYKWKFSFREEKRAVIDRASSQDRDLSDWRIKANIIPGIPGR